MAFLQHYRRSISRRKFSGNGFATTSAVTIASAKDLDVAGRDGSSNALKLNGISVTSTAAELNVLDGITGVTTAPS